MVYINVNQTLVEVFEPDYKGNNFPLTFNPHCIGNALDFFNITNTWKSEHLVIHIPVDSSLLPFGVVLFYIKNSVPFKGNIMNYNIIY